MKVVALCDVDANTLEVAAEQVNDLSGDQPKTYKDYRELLEKEKPEVVIIASPDHWHALQSIAALKAGAHVFVEKPTGHTVNESRAMFHAARDSGRVVQVGLHRRIGPHHVSGMKFLKSGAVGDVGMVRLFAPTAGRQGNAQLKVTARPLTGWIERGRSAPLRPFNTTFIRGLVMAVSRLRQRTAWRLGRPLADQVLWWSEEKYPRRVYSTAGRPIWGPAVLNDKEQTSDAPDHQVAVSEFEKFTCVWEHRRFAGNNAEKHPIGSTITAPRARCTSVGATVDVLSVHDKDNIIHEDSQLQEPDGHNLTLLWSDFLDSIEGKTKGVANIEVAHRSSVLPLLGMISWRVGRSLNWDGVKEQITGDAEASKLLSRPYRAPWVYPVA